MKKYKMKKLSREQKNNRRRILQISFDKNLSHLGSCLSCVDLIDAVYKVKMESEKLILSNGHAGIALYVILEKNGLIKNPDIIKNLNIHPDRNPMIGIPVSTGSLGQGLPIAVGIALSQRSRNVYCILSDGECSEGSIWEALRIASEQKLNNLKIIVNANGYGAYGKINVSALIPRFKSFGCAVYKVNGHSPKSIINGLKIKTKNKPLVLFAETSVEQVSFLNGQDAHYKVISNMEFNIAMKELQ